jgi:hypothetical protein
MSEFLDSETAYQKATTIEEVEIGGETAKIEVAEANLDEIQAFEEKEANGELSEVELVNQIFDEYLIRPDGLDAKKMSPSKMEGVMKGVLKAWGVEEDELDEFIEERQGN